jgi:hypothetical protein
MADDLDTPGALAEIDGWADRVLGIEHRESGPVAPIPMGPGAGERAAEAGGADSADVEIGAAGRPDIRHGGDTSNCVEPGDIDGAAIDASAVDTAETDAAAPGLVSRAVDALLGVAL